MSAPIDDGVLHDLVPRAPGVILDELARIARTLVANSRPRPDVELGLISGQLVRGKLVAVDAGTVLLHTGGQPRTPAVAFVRVDQIASLALTDASVLAHEPALAPEAPVPTRAELARRVAGLMPPIAFAAELDDAARRAVGALLPTLQHALYQISSDATKQGALAAVAGIDLAASPTGVVSRDGNRLALLAPTLASEVFTVVGLRAALARLL